MVMEENLSAKISFSLQWAFVPIDTKNVRAKYNR